MQSAWKEKHQIVHTHTPKTGVLGMISAWISRVPVRLHTVAGLPLLEAKGLKRILLDFVEKITYMCANMVYPNSYGLKKIILENGYCKSLKLNVIGNGSSNGIDTQYFSPMQVTFKTPEKYKAKYKIQDKDFVFIFIGRLELRGLDITHSNQIWCIDIKYIQMEHGILYLTAIIDVYSRYIVGWGLSSSTLGAECSLKVLKQAIAEHSKPEIVNSDQESQFTCPTWIEYLEGLEITIGMDGRGRALDNIYIERFWRTLKQEYIYIWLAEDGNILIKGLKEFLNYYNNLRTHQSLDRKTPYDWYEYAA